MTHDCRKAGFHRFGQLRWLDRKEYVFVRSCKTCLEMFVGQMITDQRTRTYNVLPITYDYNPDLGKRKA